MTKEYSDEELNVLLSKLCGWTPNKFSLHTIKCLPDYCSGLSAIREAEKTLVGDQWAEYLDNLVYMQNFGILKDDTDLARVIKHAPANVCAKALIKTFTV